MSPIYGQLLDKPLLVFAVSYGVPDVKHNRDIEIRRTRARLSRLPKLDVTVKLSNHSTKFLNNFKKRLTHLLFWTPPCDGAKIAPNGKRERATVLVCQL